MFTYIATKKKKKFFFWWKNKFYFHIFVPKKQKSKKQKKKRKKKSIIIFKQFQSTSFIDLMYGSARLSPVFKHQQVSRFLQPFFTGIYQMNLLISTATSWTFTVTSRQIDVVIPKTTSLSCSSSVFVFSVVLRFFIFPPPFLLVINEIWLRNMCIGT